MHTIRPERAGETGWGLGILKNKPPAEVVEVSPEKWGVPYVTESAFSERAL
jgi:hypothetical protein